MKLKRGIPLSLLRLAPLYVPQYCQGQDLPSFEVAMFTPNITHRSNFCFVYEAVYAGDVERRDALRGKNISIGVFDYSIDRDTGGIKKNELFAIFLDEIARRAGFEWRKTYGVLESPSDSNNYTFDEILYWATSVYDVMSEYYIRNVNRLGMGIDFMEPWYDGSLVMVMQKTKEKGLQWTTIFQPFSNMVWLVIIFTVVSSGMLYFIIDYLDSRRKSDVMEASLGGNIFHSAYAFTGHAIYIPRTISTRAVAWSLCFMFMVLTSIYTANMATLLILSKKNTVDVNVIEDAVQAGLTICVWKSSATDTYLTENHKSAKKLAFPTEDECAEALLKNECQVYLAFHSSWETLQRDTRFNKDCDLEWVGRTVEEYDGSFTSLDNKDLCSNFLNDIFTLHLVDLKIDGTFDQIWDAHYKATLTTDCETESDEDEPTSIDEARVDINQIGALFILHFTITACALIVSIVRCCRMSEDKKERISKELKEYARTPAKLKTAASFASRHSKKAIRSESFLKTIHGKSPRSEKAISFGSTDDYGVVNEDIRKSSERSSKQFRSLESCFDDVANEVVEEDLNESSVRLREQDENIGEERCKTIQFKSDVDMIPNDKCEMPCNDGEIDSTYDVNSSINDMSDEAYRAYVVQSVHKMMQDLEAIKKNQ